MIALICLLYKEELFRGRRWRPSHCYSPILVSFGGFTGIETFMPTTEQSLMCFLCRWDKALG